MVDKDKLSRGQRIAQAIEDSPFNQSQIAARVGVTPQSITKWIKTGNIYSENLHALARITGVDFDYLLYGDKPNRIGEVAAVYRTCHPELHELVDRLDQHKASQLLLCARALSQTDKHTDLVIKFGRKTVLK